MKSRRRGSAFPKNCLKRAEWKGRRVARNGCYKRFFTVAVFFFRDKSRNFTAETAPFDVAHPAAAQNKVLRQPAADELKIVGEFWKTVPTGKGRFGLVFQIVSLNFVNHFGWRSYAGVVHQLHGIGPRAFLVVEIKIIEGVKNIVGFQTRLMPQLTRCLPAIICHFPLVKSTQARSIIE